MSDNPANSVTPLEGKTTVDDKMVFEVERLGYESAADIARKISLKVSEEIKDRRVVIAGTQLLADFANLQSVYLILEGLERDYGALAKHARGVDGGPDELKAHGEGVDAGAAEAGMEGVAPLALTPVTALAEAAVGLVSLFREDIEYKGVKTEVDRLAFEIALASKIKQGGAQEVFVPDLTFISAAADAKGTLRDRLGRVHEAKAKAWAAAGPLIARLVELESELDVAAREDNQELVEDLSRRVSALRGALQPLAGPLGRADQRLADIEGQWTQGADTGVTLMSRLLRAEAIRGKMPVYLHATVVASGGHNRISRSLFRMLFLGDGLSFVGGATVRWALLGSDGSVIKGGLLVARRSSSSHSMTGDTAA